MSRLLLGSRCIVVNPKFVHASRSSQKLVRIAVEQPQVLFQGCHTITCLVRLEQTRHSLRVIFPDASENSRLKPPSYVTSFGSHDLVRFQSAIFQHHIYIFSIVSFVVTLMGLQSGQHYLCFCDHN